jgi:hypothetical protein
MSRSDEQIERSDRIKQQREARKALPPTTKRGGGVADWANASEHLVFQLVCCVAVEGGAVRYGYTRDGGAYSIGIYLGADSQTYYCNEKEGINEKLAELIEHFKGG